MYVIAERGEKQVTETVPATRRIAVDRTLLSPQSA